MNCENFFGGFWLVKVFGFGWLNLVKVARSVFNKPRPMNWIIQLDGTL